MGWDIIANLNINQDKVSAYIEEHDINKDSWEESVRVAGYFYEKATRKPVQKKSVYWDKNAGLHMICYSHCSKFICDDTRFANPAYYRVLEEKACEYKPLCAHARRCPRSSKRDAFRRRSTILC